MTVRWRLVLDPNVVLSALLFGRGRLAPLRLAWQEARFQPLVSAATTRELARALGYPKFRLAPAEQAELLADDLPWCETVSMPDSAPETPPCRDPFDIAFLQLAIVGKAGFLVSGDKDLLSLGESSPCPIITLERAVGDPENAATR